MVHWKTKTTNNPDGSGTSESSVTLCNIFKHIEIEMDLIDEDRYAFFSASIRLKKI